MFECFSVIITILGKEQREWKKERHGGADSEQGRLFNDLRLFNACKHFNINSL
jgi:hypothetical protein